MTLTIFTLPSYAAGQLSVFFKFMSLDFEVRGFSPYLRSQRGKTIKVGEATNDKNIRTTDK